MKVRKEVSGLHYFDRETGIHILFDEIKIPQNELSKSPRIVSIALTNICDLKCHFCYAPKNRDNLDIEQLKELCKQLDILGTLEITFGGGEPTLYPNFIELCQWIWQNTSLGISFTTHGHKIDCEFIDKIQGNVSMIRFSIDGIEPRYSEIRGKKLDDLLQKISFVKNKIPFGINCVVSKDKTNELEEVIKLAIGIGAENILIIPEHEQGEFNLTQSDWFNIDRIMNEYINKIEILITHEASRFIYSRTLEIAHETEFLFLHISADKKMKINSYDTNGIDINDLNKTEIYLNQITQTL